MNATNKARVTVSIFCFQLTLPGLVICWLIETTPILALLPIAIRLPVHFLEIYIDRKEQSD